MGIVLRVLMVLALAGCSTLGGAPDNGPRYATAADNLFIQANYAAADALLQRAGRLVDRKSPLVVATLVNIDNLEESTRLGRIVSEHLSTRLANRGYMVKEIKLRGTLFVKSGTGELLLSRELKDISASHQAQAVVVGTYSIARDQVYMNVKLVNAENTILAGYDYVIPLNGSLASLLVSG